MELIDGNAASLAFEKCDGASFERFGQAFLSAALGLEFVALGGFKDGGADGYVAAEGKSTEHYMQASTEEDVAEKIKRTVTRLRQVERDVQKLTYLSSRTIGMQDQLENDLSKELGVTIRIRDRKYLCDHVNDSPRITSAFNSYLAQHLKFLTHIGGSTIISANMPNGPRALCVFLGQEVERRQGKSSLLESIVDALILWALERTDPESGKFLDRNQILEIIETALPAARQFIRSELDKRLRALSVKSNSTGREIRHYKKDGKYCLPYQTREIVKHENLLDETLKLKVTELFEARAREKLPSDHKGLAGLSARLCHATLEMTFYKQGIELAGFVHGETNADALTPSIQDNLRSVIDDADGIGSVKGPLIEDACLAVLRKTFYDSEEAEREYLSKLSRTYFLLFSLQAEPRIVEYFQNMAANLNLYVGADLIVRAMSERFLNKTDQAMLNCFSVLAAAGSKLILTEKVVEEVLSHLRAQDLEFKNHYAGIEPYTDVNLASQIDRILIRAYFYARLGRQHNRLAGWRSYIEQFCSYSDLHTSTGFESLRRSLCEEYNFDYESTEEMERYVDRKDTQGLADELARVRRQKTGSQLLEYNDALQVLRIYARRELENEFGRGHPFGFKTWWLTKETVVLQAAAPLIERKRSPFWMRPEFILNFIALSPTKQSVATSYRNVFPSLLGVKLSNRLKPEITADFRERIREAAALSDARARAIVSELSDKLKSDRQKRYEFNLDN